MAPPSSASPNKGDTPMSAFMAASTVLIVSLCAHARVSIWATDKACPAITPAVFEVGRVPFPRGWTVIVACNDLQWDMLRRKAGALGTQHAFTNLRARITIVRGAIFLRGVEPLRGVEARTAHRILLHEIGHIRCACDDEAKAEAWAAACEHTRSDGCRR